jgi:4-hydroxy-tetrahydrodipicolinate reductase
MKIAICGSSGKVGQLVVNLATELGHDVVARITGSNGPDDSLAKADVCIDFSVPAGTVSLCEAAIEFHIPVVTGTTGLGDDAMRRVQDCARVIPILMSSNFAVGIQAVKKLIREAVVSLPADFDIEIIEKHHGLKKDAPSGTALSILEDLRELRPDIAALFGRHGKSTRRIGEVCIHAVRGGDTSCDHSVLFLGPGESVEIIHRAMNREVFARGAIFAAEKFCQIRKPGLYKFADVMGELPDQSR